MNYTEAVALAKAGMKGDTVFFMRLPIKVNNYLALQYVKNEETARDVLQEAYIRAFTKLDMLAEPEAFPGWLGKIVANTAKNVLVKKNPMLFSEMGAEDEGRILNTGLKMTALKVSRNCPIQGRRHRSWCIR